MAEPGQRESTKQVPRSRRASALPCRCSTPRLLICLLLLVQDVENINNKVKEAIQEAEDTCSGGDAAHCAAA